MSTETPFDEGESTNHDRRTGRFLPNNVAAFKHGRRSTVVRRHIEEESREQLAERRQAIIEDLGGAAELSIIATDVLERYLISTALLHWMEDRLIADGVLTGRGRRRSVHHAYLAQLNQSVKLANLLGLKRVPKSVPTLAQVLSGAADRGPESLRVARSTAGGYQDQGIPSDSDSGPAPRPCPRPCPRPRLAVRLPGIEPEDGVIPDVELHDGGAP